MAAHTLRIDRTQDIAWSKGDFNRSTRKTKTSKRREGTLTKIALFNDHLAALDLVEHCTSVLTSPDHKMYLGTIRNYHEEAIQTLSSELQTLAMKKTTGPHLHLLEPEKHFLTNDCEDTLALLKQAEEKLKTSHLELLMDARAPLSLRNHFGMNVLKDLNGFLEGIDRIARSLP